MLQMWLNGVEGLLQFRELAFLALGMFIGLFFGAIPGLGGAAALALLMPLTYGLEPFTALALSGGVMGGVPMGGSITAILLNTPGSAPNAATAIDGYPLAQQGKAEVVLICHKVGLVHSLWRNGNQRRAERLDLGTDCAHGLQLAYTKGAPASAEKAHDERAFPQ